MTNFAHPLLLLLAFFGAVFLAMMAWETFRYLASWVLWLRKNREDCN